MQPALIILAGHASDLLLMVQIPTDCFAYPGDEGLGGAPAQLALDFGGIDGVALVMPRPVGD